MDESSTNQRLQRARHGDVLALGKLLETYRVYLELLARLEIGRQLQTKVDATDVVQETFLEAHRHFANFRGVTEVEFVAWLRSIFALQLAQLVRHYLGTQGRDLRREQSLEINFDQTSHILNRGLFAEGNSPSQSVLRREQGILLAEALAALPEDYREVVVLRNLEELPFAVIAERLGRSVDSIQKLWIRALAKLRNLME